MNDILAEAVRLAALGLNVLSLHAPVATESGCACTCGDPECERKGRQGKHPHLLKWGETTAAENLEQIRDRSVANLGLATGVRGVGVWALDVDPRHDGPASLQALVKAHGELPRTVQARTGSGGSHYLFAYPKIGEIRNGVGTGKKGGIGKGLDFRGDGGFIVVAPSRHASGGRYAWEKGQAPGEIPFADAPAWLLKLVVKQARVKSLAQTPGISVETDALRAKLRRIRAEDTRELGRKILDGEALAEAGARNTTLYEAVSLLVFTAPEATDQQYLDLLRPSIDKMIDAGSSVNHDTAAEMIPRTRENWVEVKTVERAQNEALIRSMLGGSVPAAAMARDPNDPPKEGDGDPSVMAEAPSAGTPPPPTEKINFPPTDTGNSERFVVDHGRDLKFCHERGVWFLWDNVRWVKDVAETAFLCTKITARSMSFQASEIEDDKQRAALQAWAKKSESIAARRAMLDGARAEQAVAVAANAFDADPWALNCLNGILNLKTGDLEPHRREALCSKLVPVAYNPQAQCPKWHAFLAQVQPDVRMRAYLQREAGYALTGVIREHVLPIHIGKGGNGKGVNTNTRLRIMGDYARQVPPEIFVEKHGGSDNSYYERATLFGCRFAAASETAEGKELNVSLVKAITGGDKISARHMREDFFDFWPTHKVELCTQHRPIIKETKEGIWRRVHVIPWNVVIPASEANLDLANELFEEEAEGILAWMVEGCRLWQLEGLNPPESILLATQDYREKEDLIGEFLGDCAEIGKDNMVSVTELRAVYETWCQQNGHVPMKPHAVNARLENDGHVRGPRRLKGEAKSRKMWIGFQLNGKPLALESGETSDGMTVASEEIKNVKPKPN